MSAKMIEEQCNFETKRLSVKSWTKQVEELGGIDIFAEKVIEILSPNVTKNLPDGWQNITTKNEAQEWIKDRNAESHFVCIQLLDTKEPVGFIFFYESDTNDVYYNLRFGYLLSEKVWGKGVGTELIDGLINWCKTEGNIRSISGGVECDNIGSIKVLEKNGFKASSIDSPSADILFYEYQFDVD
ncbi:GNAT family N-acetyltransferase [Sediminitomix flava]|uniref:Acetyltransferase (GNAT) family protein n=1 Tax=Sediminitomix flava TaxID=379075 RepID=A0A315ZAT0_SEDFL|nr:GNAT family N-acetyltransferase [Sediminitomix flava]PWJ42685.1 acetyltransferase (GNAT) family protein [Sediminitomix flava]